MNEEEEMIEQQKREAKTTKMLWILVAIGMLAIAIVAGNMMYKYNKHIDRKETCESMTETNQDFYCCYDCLQRYDITGNIKTGKGCYCGTMKNDKFSMFDIQKS